MVDTRRYQGPVPTSYVNSDDNMSIPETNLKRTGSLKQKKIESIMSRYWCCVLCTFKAPQLLEDVNSLLHFLPVSKVHLEEGS